jgi:LemA protein
MENPDVGVWMRFGTMRLAWMAGRASTGSEVTTSPFMGASFIVPGAAFILLFIALAVPAFFILMWLVGGYNRLVALRNGYRNAYAQVADQLKRRYDLIPTLVEIAKAYIPDDRGTLEAVGAARNAALAANLRAALAPGDVALMKELSGAETGLAGTLGRLLTAAAACPDLKADATLVSLIRELTSTATKAAAAGQAYNDAVMRYNTLRVSFPTNLIAVPLSFAPAELFVLNGLVSKPV